MPVNVLFPLNWKEENNLPEEQILLLRNRQFGSSSEKAPGHILARVFVNSRERA